MGIVRDVLFKKHPDPALVSLAHCLLTETPPLDHEPHSVNFEQISGVLIRRMILQMDGAAGPSGLDVLRECVYLLVESLKICVSRLPVLQGNCVEAIWIQLKLGH